jgi:hypothetical protein
MGGQFILALLQELSRLLLCRAGRLSHFGALAVFPSIVSNPIAPAALEDPPTSSHGSPRLGRLRHRLKHRLHKIHGLHIGETVKCRIHGIPLIGCDISDDITDNH